MCLWEFFHCHVSPKPLVYAPSTAAGYGPPHGRTCWFYQRRYWWIHWETPAPSHRHFLQTFWTAGSRKQKQSCCCSPSSLDKTHRSFQKSPLSRTSWGRLQCNPAACSPGWTAPSESSCTDGPAPSFCSKRLSCRKAQSDAPASLAGHSLPLWHCRGP